MKSIILDASVTMAWCFEDEKTPYTEEVLELLSHGTVAIVPPLWTYEVLNVLALAKRHKRITHADAIGFWHRIGLFHIRTTELPSASILEVFEVADQYKLTIYDATYLLLALHQGLSLATLDKDLKKAAKLAGVVLV